METNLVIITGHGYTPPRNQSRTEPTMYKYLSIIICLIVIGCDNYSKEVPVISIETGFGNAREYKLSEIADSISYCLLDVVVDCKIGVVHSIEINDSNIIIFDDLQQKIFVFDIHGKFLYQLSNRGKTPWEFIDIISIELKEFSDTLFVYDQGSRDIKLFNIRENKYLSSFHIDISPVNFLVHQNSIYLHNPRPLNYFSNRKLVTQLDLNGKLLRQFGKRKKQNPARIATHFSQIFMANGNPCFWDSYSDTVYTIVDNSEQPKYVIEVGEQKIPQEYLEDREKWNRNWMNYNMFHWIIETEKYFFLEGISKRTKKLILFDRSQGMAFNVCNSSGYSLIENDIDNGYPFWPDFITSKGDLVQIIEPISWCNYLTTDLYVSTNKDISNPISSFETNEFIKQNPIILIAYLN